jgi:ribonucleoside-diphosphate reductase alpha chain
MVHFLMCSVHLVTPASVLALNLCTCVHVSCRSALISLSSVDDDTMRSAKAGAWWEDAAQRAMANNSAVYTEKPSIGTFLAEWKALYDSGSGERGLFSRAAAQRQAARNGRRDATQPFGTNPCW